MRLDGLGQFRQFIAQFVGHHIEGRRPAFFTDLVYLLIGPAWIVAKVLRRIGVAV